MVDRGFSVWEQYFGFGVTPCEDINFGSSTLSSMALERKSSIQLNRSRVRGVESVVCYVPYPTIQSPIFFMFHMCFGLVLKSWALQRVSNVLGQGFSVQRQYSGFNVWWGSVHLKHRLHGQSHYGKRKWKDLIGYCFFFISGYFIYNLRMYCARVLL